MPNYFAVTKERAPFLMDQLFFKDLYYLEKTHWWFFCRRKFISDFLTLYRSIPSPRILDMGCGTGGMLDDLSYVGPEFGLDVSSTAIEFCRTRGHNRLVVGSGESLPYKSASFDAIVSLDVFEHIENDLLAFKSVQRICAPGAVVILAVPAMPFLWTSRDDRLLHRRRYTRGGLIDAARLAGFEVIRCSYYCVFYFPVVVSVVLASKLAGMKPHISVDIPTVNPILNYVFRQILSAEQWVMRWVNFPFGVSLVCVLRKGVANNNNP